MKSVHVLYPLLRQALLQQYLLLLADKLHSIRYNIETVCIIVLFFAEFFCSSANNECESTTWPNYRRNISDSNRVKFCR